MPRSLTRSALMFVAALMAGCGPTDALLLVTLKSDLTPGVEVARAVLSVDGVVSRELALESTTDLLGGVRVEETAPLGERMRLEARLHDAAGDLVVERVMLVELDSAAQAVTFVLARACREARCGDGETCVAGRCVSQSCSELRPDLCPAPECAQSADCAPPFAACGAPLCADGVCLEVAAEPCGEGLYCDPTAGCRPAGRPDAFALPVPVEALGEAGDPALSRDLLELLCVRREAGVDRLFRSRRAALTEPWGALERIDSLGVEPVQGPELAEEDLTLFFTDGGDLHRARRASAAQPWSRAERIPELESGAAQFSPTLTGDGLEMYFTSEGSISRTTRATRSDPWTRATSVEELATPEVEGSPAVSPDGLTLAFSRAQPTGERALYVTRREGRAAPFDPPRILEELTVEGASDLNPWISDGARLLCFERRLGGARSVLCTRR